MDLVNAHRKAAVGMTKMDSALGGLDLGELDLAGLELGMVNTEVRRTCRVGEGKDDLGCSKLESRGRLESCECGRVEAARSTS